MFKKLLSRHAAQAQTVTVAPNAVAQAPAPAERGAMAAVQALAHQASTVGREAAEVRGAIEDTRQAAQTQALALNELVAQLGQVQRAQDAIAQQSRDSVQAVATARLTVESVGHEVGGIVDSLRSVSDAARQITQIALQTRLVAFNASVEAKRAGEAGRGFAVVADAVKDLAAKVETSSKDIMGTVKQLDERIAALAREIQRRDAGAGSASTLSAPAALGAEQGSAPGTACAGERGGAVHRALAAVDARVAHIASAAQQSHGLCHALSSNVGGLSAQNQSTTGALDVVLSRTEKLLQVSEQLIETTAGCGVVTADTPFIAAAQEAAAQIAQLLEAALRTGAASEAELFDENYRAIAGSAPAQHTAAFVALADRLFPQVQEKMLALSDKVVYCIAADRNGYVACHNRQYNQPQRPGELAWNTAHCRNRRIFNDRSGLASARNTRPFLLQTYRRDMGGGQFIVMKEAAAPIVVNGRHWGGLRLAFRFS